MTTLTGSQNVLSVKSGDELLHRDQPFDWKQKVRKMRRDPTIAFVRQLLLAPIMASDWAYVKLNDSVPEEVANKVSEFLEPLRFSFLMSSVYGCIDFGWQPFEKVLDVNSEGYTYIRKLKPLLQDWTIIRVDEHGNYAGLKNTDNDGTETVLEPENTLTVAFDVEGTDWYGQATMRNVESTYDAWNDTDISAKRFDKKVAGSHWVVHYPVGVTDGVDNFEIAKEILQNIESSGRIAIPKSMEAWDSEGGDKLGWKIELITASGSSSFETRLSYLDRLKVRALGFPERAILEGQFGTRADAGEHADFALSALGLKHIQILEYLNKYCVDDITFNNFGLRNAVKIIPTPLSDDKKLFLREVYKSLLANPEAFLEESDAIDRDALRDTLGVPFTLVEDDLRITL